MTKQLLQDIREIAKEDFASVQKNIRSKKLLVNASLNNIRMASKDNAVRATCSFSFAGTNDVIDATICYESTPQGIFADSEIPEVSEAIMSAIATPIMAAEDDPNDEFDFDAFDEDSDQDSEDQEDTSLEESSIETVEDIEDPEDEPNIETDNNIAGHYIVECDRCHGIFISALTESDQVVESITGVCPLCEKESDQYVKWVVKPVEFQ